MRGVARGRPTPPPPARPRPAPPGPAPGGVVSGGARVIRLSLVACLFGAAVAAAGAPGPPLSAAAKAMNADAVVVGKVTGIETEAMEVLPFEKAPAKVKVHVATIKVESGLIGAKNLTHLKVLIEAKPEQPRPGRPGPITLADGQDGLFFLHRHPTTEGYFVLFVGSPPVGPTAPTYAADVATATGIAAVLNAPLTALAAEKADDRLSAAFTLLGRYRRTHSGPTAEEAIPAGETKAILKILADADWARTVPAERNGARWGPRVLLDWVGLTPGVPGGLPVVTVGPGEDISAKTREAYKVWYAKHAATFEIKRFVPKGK